MVYECKKSTNILDYKDAGFNKAIFCCLFQQHHQAMIKNRKSYKNYTSDLKLQLC